ncbi:hypothetical protein D3C72_1549500 [compost metagenome]
MGGWQCQDQTVALDDPGRQRWVFGQWPTHQRGVNLIGPQHFRQAHGTVLAQFQFDVGVTVAKGRKVARQQHISCRAHEPQAQAAQFPQRHAPRRLPRLVRMEQRTARILHQGGASRSQRHPLGAAFKKLHTHNVFQFLYRHR